MFHKAFADPQALEDDDEFPLEEGDIEWSNEELAQVECLAHWRFASGHMALCL